MSELKTKQESRSAEHAPAARPGPPPRSWLRIVFYALHGSGFLALTAIAMLRFGQVFDFIDLIVAAMSALTLREAWNELRHHPHK